ncbi:MAG: serine/threonine protein phosphatase [Candidatus Sericytochromatia bacterium]|nr:serine/threonine protein phosphatase [Candidatus Sericytochromatia bacterium]
MNQSKPSILIGDVHGCLAELQALWSNLPLSSDAEIIFLGDLIDKGPNSDGVLQFLSEMKNHYDIKLILGNHELKALKRAKKSLPVGFTPTDENVKLLECSLPFYSFGDGRYLALHAGIFPAFFQSYPKLPDLSQAGEWDSKLVDRVHRFTFCRYVNPAGQTVSLGQEQAQDYFWAESYDGRWGHVFFGHQPLMNGVGHFPHATGLDTGCVYGGHLTAAYIDAHSQIQYFQVRAENKFADLLTDGYSLKK